MRKNEIQKYLMARVNTKPIKGLATYMKDGGSSPKRPRPGKGLAAYTEKKSTK